MVKIRQVLSDNSCRYKIVAFSKAWFILLCKHLQITYRLQGGTQYGGKEMKVLLLYRDVFSFGLWYGGQ